MIIFKTCVKGLHDLPQAGSNVLTEGAKRADAAKSNDYLAVKGLISLDIMIAEGARQEGHKAEMQ